MRSEQRRFLILHALILSRFDLCPDITRVRKCAAQMLARLTRLRVTCLKLFDNVVLRCSNVQTYTRARNAANRTYTANLCARMYESRDF